MVLPIPIDYLKEEERFQIVKEAESAARNVLAQEIAGPIVTRTLKPADVGLSGNTFEWSLGGTGEDTLVDKTLDDDESIVIYGFTLLAASPTITRIVIKNGAETVADINFEEISARDVKEFFLDTPIGFRPKSRMIITAYNTAGAATTEKMVIKGIVAERAGKTIVAPR